MLTLVHETAWHKKVVWAAICTFKRIISVPIDFLNKYISRKFWKKNQSVGESGGLI